MSVSLVLFTADLRVHDQPVLRAALAGADEVVPLFVVDSGVRAAGFDVPNRRAFLFDCLADLDNELRRRSGRLIVRTGEVVEQVCTVAAEAGARDVHVAGDVSGYAQRREDRLRAALETQGRRLLVHDAVVTALAPGAVTPQDRDHFAVFTPYFRRWESAGPRDVVRTPRTVRVPDTIASQPLPSRADVTGVSPRLPGGGESEGRRRLTACLRGPVDAYARQHDDLSADATSRLSPYLHFGALTASQRDAPCRRSPQSISVHCGSSDQTHG
ncbi:MAG TPA: hypothetical protein DEQ61_19405 [Streptomyces sp.]|nr:hypothetical protein [Streptomyces sp.]